MMEGLLKMEKGGSDPPLCAVFLREPVDVLVGG